MPSGGIAVAENLRPQALSRTEPSAVTYAKRRALDMVRIQCQLAQHAASESVRLQATEYVLNRALGRPEAAGALAGAGGLQITVVIGDPRQDQTEALVIEGAADAVDAHASTGTDDQGHVPEADKPQETAVHGHATPAGVTQG